MVVTVKNTGNRVHDFTLNPITIESNVSGPIPQNINLQINTDSLMPDSSREYVLTSLLKLSRPGSYSINSQLIQLAPDSNATNETAFAPEINMQVTNPTICEGDSVQLQATSSVSGLTQPVVFESGNLGLTIPDSDPTGITSTITVNNVPFAANQIISVTIDSIIHPSVGDLILTLISPSGIPVYLSVNNGNGANYIGTTFNVNAQNSIFGANAPFTGEFIPQSSFSAFTGNANGNWTLLVKDISDQNTVNGIIYSWKLEFPQQNNVTSQVWTPGSNIISANSLSPIVYPVQTTNYYLTVIDANSCSSFDSVLVTVNSGPAVSFELSVNSTCVNSGLLQLDGVNPSGGLFSGTGVIQPDSFDPALAGAGAHVITYLVSDNIGCSSSVLDTINVGTCDALNEINSNALNVYPNPFCSHLDVVYNDNDFNVLITDALGRTVHLKENCVQKTTLNTVQLEPGIYFICLINKQKQIVVKKLIKN
jgi:subtilisin-like proprotein convertase family protein